MIRECLRLRQEFTKKDQVLIAEAMIVLASILEKKDDFSQAEGYLRKAIESIARDPGSGKEKRREAIELLIKVYERWGKPESAEMWGKKLTE